MGSLATSETNNTIVNEVFTTEVNIGAEIVPFNKEDRYKKSNLLISSKYSSCLLDNQLLAMATQSLKETNDGKIVSVMSASEIKTLLKKNYCQAYNELKKASLRLKKNFIMIEDPENNRFQISNLISDCIYDNGVFTLTWNPTLRNALFSLKNYTMLSLSAMVSWESNITFRLYEVLKSECYIPKGYHNAGNIFEKTYNLSELKVTLGAIDLTNDKISIIVNKYKKAPNYDNMLEEIEALAEKYPSEKLKPKWKRWVDFQKQVLKPACDEMNSSPKSDLRVSYQPVKVGKGGKTTAVKFIIELINNNETGDNTKTQGKDLLEDEKLDFIDSVLDLINEPIKIKDAKAIAEVAEYDMGKIEKAISIMKHSNVNDTVGFLIDAIKKNYNEPVKKTKTKFENFEQRVYDFDTLLSDE